MGDTATHRWVEDASGLRALAQALADCTELALDSESNSGFAYRERLCLLQINDGTRIWLVDLLALPGEKRALEPLRGVFEEVTPRVWLHGGEFDVGCLKRDYGIQLRGVWDTQQAASFLGWKKTGYGAVVERLCGVSLPKSYTRYDWGRRPLPSAVLRYAVNDVLYLPELARHLGEAVRAADLEDEVEIACRAVESATWNGGFRLGGVWSLKGARQLSDDAQAVLVALYEWREVVARRLDRPPGRTIHNQVLLALSRHAPTDPVALKRVGVPRRVTDRWAGELLDVISRARRHPPELPPRPDRRPLDRRARQRGARLQEWRRREAQRRGVPLQVVLPVAALKHLQEHGAGDLPAVPQLGEKRIRLYGESIRKLVGGDAQSPGG